MDEVKYIEIQEKLNEMYESSMNILQYINTAEQSRPLTPKETALKTYMTAMRSATADAMQTLDQG